MKASQAEGMITRGGQAFIGGMVKGLVWAFLSL